MSSRFGSQRTVGLLLALALPALGGCAGHGPAANAPIRSAGSASRYVPPADRFLSSTLLTFESPVDLAFVEPARASTVVVDSATAGLGTNVGTINHALVVTGPTSLKIGSLVSGREFPGPWDLVGLRVGSASSAGGRVRLAFSRSDAMATTTGASTKPLDVVEADLAPGAWTTLWLETPTDAATTTTSSTSRPNAPLRLDVQPLGGGAVWVDDLVLAQGGRVVAESRVPQTDQAWQVRRVGRAWQARVDGAVVFNAPAAPFAAGGYAVVEASPVRVVLSSPTGTLALDRLGRVIENGRVRLDARRERLLADDGMDAAARLEVVVGDDGDGAGRVERTLPGDADNDGYDESRGCYAVRAAGARLAVRLSSAGAPVRWPVLEVQGLPPGAVSVYVEGQTVPHVTRGPDGQVTIELPLTVRRPIEVGVSVK